MENKGLIKKEENNFLNKIISFFKNIFYKTKVEKVESVQETPVKEEKESQQNNSNDFLENLKVQEVMDYFSILTLQNKFEAGEITEDDLTDEEYEALAKKYIQEIEELKIKISQRKVQLGIA